MTQLAQVLNFIEALRLTERGKQITEAKRRRAAERAEAKPVRMTRCHDGVYRVLPDAPKFEKGGHAEYGGHEYIINPNAKFTFTFK